MSTFKNIIVAGGLALAALTAAAPAADARVTVGVGIGIGGPVHHRHFCRHHPYQCGGAVVGPRIGVYYGGRGWWDGHRYWGHRYRWHGGWRYR